MKIRIIIFSTILIICSSKEGYNQNLVSNPGFEDFIIIPVTPPCFNKPCCLVAQPTEWRYTNGHVWWPWNPNSVHYFTSAMNFCTDEEWPIPYQGVPIHSWNGSQYTLNGYYYQVAKDGFAYMMLRSYNFQNINWRQCPMVKLNDSLKVGHKYCLSFWLSVPDSWYFMSSNTIGAYFSTIIPEHNTLTVLEVVPQIENKRTDFPDTSNTWYLVSGSFVADSSYQYLTIGNFYPDSLTNVQIDFIPPNHSVDFVLYLDMVALYDCTGHRYQCNAGGGKRICAGESVVLGTDEDSRRQYHWSPATGLNDPSAARPIASPTETTTYYLYVIDEFLQQSYDTVTVEVVNCDIFIPNIFSPNNDGLNDVLYVRGEGIAQLSFVIFNRWGEKVFESNDPHQGWDGMFKGKQAETGVYVYLVEARLENGMTVKRSGNVTLVR
jgi:gliding motility-associated-like protein